MISDEKPTANGDGESGTVKDVSNKTETKRVAALKELGRLHHNEAVAFLGERQDSPVWRSSGHPVLPLGHRSLTIFTVWFLILQVTSVDRI